MAEVIFSDNALDDIQSIAEFIARDSEKFARNQVRKFFEMSETLQDFPQLGRIVPEVAHATIRELISGNYRLIYWIPIKSRIVIICVFHSGRKLNKSFIRNRKKL